MQRFSHCCHRCFFMFVSGRPREFARAIPHLHFDAFLAHAATQEKTARRLPLATLSRCLEPHCAWPDRTVRDSTGRGGGRGSSRDLWVAATACTASPSPLTPLPARTRQSSQKGVPHPAVHPFSAPTGPDPFQAHSLDWKMLSRKFSVGLIRRLVGEPGSEDRAKHPREHARRQAGRIDHGRDNLRLDGRGRRGRYHFDFDTTRCGRVARRCDRDCSGV